MPCYSPITLRNDTGYLTVPCGLCIGCLKRKRQEWSFRIKQELKESTSANFVTLTYDDENMIYNSYGQGTLYKPDLQNFFKRLRKREKGIKIRYFAVGEYGGKTYRPHYHIILFNTHNIDNIVNSWSKGFVHIGDVNDESINYITKYIIGRFDNHPYDTLQSFSLMSRKPAIGHAYIEKTKRFHKKRLKPKVWDNGVEIPMPRYYKIKIFTEQERVFMFNQQKEEYIEKAKQIERKAELLGRNPFVDEIEKNKCVIRRAHEYAKCKL